MIDFPSTWEKGIKWPAFLRAGMEHYDLWRGIYDRVVLPGWAIEEFMRSPARKFLVIAADWCGDAANTVPVLARLADLIPGMELRILVRDQFPAIMDAYLTNGSRSIPIAIALDEQFSELGHWGPRPAALQEWVLGHMKLMPSPQRYAYARKWYAKDKGETTLREVLTALSHPRG